jgi:hypothetical protein
MPHLGIPATPSDKEISKIIAYQIPLRFRADRTDTSPSLPDAFLLLQLGLTSTHQFVPVNLLHHTSEREEQHFRLCEGGLQVDLNRDLYVRNGSPMRNQMVDVLTVPVS